MFGEFRRDLEKYTKETPKIFEKTAKYGARKFVNEAKDLTDKEGLVDTGNYERNWFADAETLGNINIVNCENNVDYASHLEWGHKLRNGERYKGHFIGQRAMDEAEFKCLEKLQDELDKIIGK